MAAANTTPAPGHPPQQSWTVIERGKYRYPPGLSLNLLFYLRRRFFKPSNPILLFEHLAATYGRIAHYKLGWQHIVFINHPEFIREILVNHPQEMIKERTQRRMKILLGEGLITSEGAFHMRQRRIAAPAFHRQRIAAYADVMTERAARAPRKLACRPDHRHRRGDDAARARDRRAHALQYRGDQRRARDQSRGQRHHGPLSTTSSRCRWPKRISMPRCPASRASAARGRDSMPSSNASSPTTAAAPATLTAAICSPC